ncbi:MAG: DNA modification methylase [Planctomycetaceae bacterium]|nr:DNA modification methylase [Planctomycetaceae bacterium]
MPLSIEYVPFVTLAAADYNPRTIDQASLKRLAALLDSHGFVDPLIARREDRLVIGGHQRLKANAIRQYPDELVPVVFLEGLSDAKAKALNIALNNQEAQGTFDPAMLAGVLKDIDSACLGIDMTSVTGFTDAEIQKVLRLAGDPDVHQDAAPLPPDKATTLPGDLWTLGEHRLLCGDSSSVEDLDRLMGGSTVHLVNTDPPYNVKVEPRSNNAIAAGLSSFEGDGLSQRKFLNKTCRVGDLTHHQQSDVSRNGLPRATHDKLRAKDRPLMNDFVSDEAFDAMLKAWFGNITRVLEPGRGFYIWGGYSNIANYPPALVEAGLYFSQMIIWDKQHPVMTRKDYMGCHEWCFYGWKEGAAHRFYGPANEQDIWQVKKVSPQKMVHLTEKPVELAARAVRNSSLPGENVLDLFGGSGSTLIACEQTGRRAFLMELDPLYCDVIVQRWEALSGQKAQRGNGPSPAQPDAAGQ